MIRSPEAKPAPPQSLAGLAESARRARKRGPAPVHLWNPPYCGDIGMAIGADGAWSYGGSPIGRKAMVELFATILRKDEDGRHYLVTPVEKILIKVADAPFLAVEMAREGRGKTQSLSFRTNVDDWVEANGEHPMRFVRAGKDDGLKPYVLVRGRLEARLTRALTYDLVELAMVKGKELGIWSGGEFFAIGDAKAVS